MSIEIMLQPWRPLILTPPVVHRYKHILSKYVQPRNALGTVCTADVQPTRNAPGVVRISRFRSLLYLDPEK